MAVFRDCRLPVGIYMYVGSRRPSESTGRVGNVQTRLIFKTRLLVSDCYIFSPPETFIYTGKQSVTSLFFEVPPVGEHTLFRHIY